VFAGAIGDAYAQNKQPEEALDNYQKQLRQITMILLRHVLLKQVKQL
jgi:hypothetical protein